VLHVAVLTAILVVGSVLAFRTVEASLVRG
jgi:hypothetical protein